MKDKVLLFVILIFNCTLGFAQEPTKTIKLHDFCANIPVESVSADLFLFSKNSKSFTYTTNVRISYHRLRKTDHTVVSGIDEYVVNQIVVKGVTYYEYNGVIRLAAIDMRKNRNVKIQLLGPISVHLSRKLTLDELLQISQEELPTPQPCTMAPFNYKRKTYPANTVYYEMTYFTGENDGGTLLHLFFDTKKHLRMVTIDYYNEEIVIHKQFPPSTR